MSRVAYVVAYDIADDDRRADVAMFLSGYGPRVQLSVFEAELPDAEAQCHVVRENKFMEVYIAWSLARTMPCGE